MKKYALVGFQLIPIGSQHLLGLLEYKVRNQQNVLKSED